VQNGFHDKRAEVGGEAEEEPGGHNQGHNAAAPGGCDANKLTPRAPSLLLHGMVAHCNHEAR
jgi:hypothetical protein